VEFPKIFELLNQPVPDSTVTTRIYKEMKEDFVPLHVRTSSTPEEDGSSEPDGISFIEFATWMYKQYRYKIKLHRALMIQARNIYDKYVSLRAPRQVNINGPTQEKLTQQIEDG
jgi:hypothetical protein